MIHIDQAKKVCLFSKEAGAAAYLSELAQSWVKEKSIHVFTYKAGKSSYGNLFASVTEVEDNFDLEKIFQLKPEILLSGGSARTSLEKKLWVEAKKRNIPVYVYIDHYWNLWQRFAHEETAKRWVYLPDRVYVLSEACKNKMLDLGCPVKEIFVNEHPVLKKISSMKAVLSSSKVRAQLSIFPETKIILFVSEHEFSPSESWQWEQPLDEDVLNLCHILLESIESLNSKNGKKYVLLIKEHPAENRNWQQILSKHKPTSYQVLKSSASSVVDKMSLIDASECVFGLSSMLLLEAVYRNKNVYSYHSDKTNSAHWLSQRCDRVIELESKSEILSALKK